MLELVRQHGTKSWGIVGASLAGRTGKQVSESSHVQYSRDS